MMRHAQFYPKILKNKGAFELSIRSQSFAHKSLNQAYQKKILMVNSCLHAKSGQKIRKNQSYDTCYG